MTGVTAILTTLAPRKELGIVLDALEQLPVDEVIVVENGPNGKELAADGIRVLRPGRNLGIEGRNLGAREARNDLCSCWTTIRTRCRGRSRRSRERFETRRGSQSQPDSSAMSTSSGAPRGSGAATPSTTGSAAGEARTCRVSACPAFFFPEGASMVRRDAFLEVGGFFDPLFHGGAGLDVATVLLGSGWDVRYFPSAPFVHLKAEIGRDKSSMLRLRVRNQLWYFYRHFPVTVAARRIPAYLLFDLLESTKSGALQSWAGGVHDAWSERAVVRGTREPLPREVIRRAELNRGRLHLRLLALRAARLARQVRPRST